MPSRFGAEPVELPTSGNTSRFGDEAVSVPVATPHENEGMWSRYLRQSGISGVGDLLGLLSDPSRIPAVARAAVQPGVDIAHLIGQGKFAEAGNKTGETVGNLIPGVSAAGDVIKDVASGEYRNILPDAAGAATQLFIPKAISKIPEVLEAAKGSNIASKILKTQPLREGVTIPGPGTDRLPGVGAPIPNTGLEPTAIGESSPIKSLTEVYSPSNTLKFQDDLKRAIPEIKQVAPNVDSKTLPNAIQTAKYQIGEKFNTYMQRAEGMGLHVDGNEIADRILEAVPDKFKQMNSGAYKQLTDSLAPYRRNFSPTELKGFLETTNDQLSSFYKGLPDAVDAKLGANTHIATLDAEANALRDSIYNKIDPETGGENVRELQRRYGSILGLEAEHDRFLNRAGKTPMPNILQNAEQAGRMIPGVAATIRHIPMSAEGSLKMGADVKKLDRALKSYKPGPGQGYAANVPEAPPYPLNLHATEGSPEFVRQRGLGEVEPLVPRTAPFEEEAIPRAQLDLTSPGNGPSPTQPKLDEFQSQTRPELAPLKSNPKYTWYEESEQRPPLQMKRPQAEQMDWQKLLFPEQPEGIPPGRAAGPIPGEEIK